LTAEILHDRITVSFSIDERDGSGRKLSSFYSTTVRRREGDGVEQGGFTPEDARLIRLVLSKQVVSTVYDDAVARRMMPPVQAQEELSLILENYDRRLTRLLAKEDA
jgi:hypothetical protein